MKSKKTLATKSKEKLQKGKNKKITTEITKATAFYKAEEYHQKYFQKHKFQKMFMCRM